MSTTLRVSIDEYHSMIARGAFNDLHGRRIELIHGELRAMSPQGPWHSEMVCFLDEWSTIAVGQAVKKRIQMPISLPTLDSEPEPDIVWAKRKSYGSGHPLPEDVLLLIEVGYSSLADDLGEHADLYAQAGIAEYWVVDLVNRLVHVFRQPSAVGYAVHDRISSTGAVSPLAFPAVTLRVEELFPK